MILFLLAYLGGVLTIVSPCILPVLPFVFARADRKFLQSGLPMLVGLCLAFAAVATLASVAGGWAVQANAAGRWIAMALLALFGVTLLFPALADRLTRPLVALGGRMSASIDAHEHPGGSIAPSLLLGVATGLLWAPCAGPILGLILTGAAIQGANAKTTLLLLAEEIWVRKPVSRPSAMATTAASTSTPRPRRIHSPACSDFFIAAKTRPPTSRARAREVAAPRA